MGGSGSSAIGAGRKMGSTIIIFSKKEGAGINFYSIYYRRAIFDSEKKKNLLDDHIYI